MARMMTWRLQNTRATLRRAFALRPNESAKWRAFERKERQKVAKARKTAQKSSEYYFFLPRPFRRSNRTKSQKSKIFLVIRGVFLMSNDVSVVSLRTQPNGLLDQGSINYFIDFVKTSPKFVVFHPSASPEGAQITVDAGESSRFLTRRGAAKEDATLIGI